MRNALLLCQYELVCLTEIWLVPEISDDILFLPDYSILRNDRKTTKIKATTHGGVLLAVKHDKPFTKLHFELSDCLIAQIQTPNPFLFCCLYSTPTPSTYRHSVKKFMTFFERLNQFFSSPNCPNVLLTGKTNFNATTWPIMQSTDANEQIRILDLMTDFNYNQQIVASIDKLDVVLGKQPELIPDTKVDLQLNALYCQPEKNLSDDNSFQITLNTIAMVSETNQNCDQDFLDSAVFCLVNANWERAEIDIEKKAFQTILLQ